MFNPVLGYEGIYCVSDAGVVIRRKTDGSRYERRLKAWPDRRGYLRVKLSKHGKVQTIAVHKLVMEAFVGPMPDAATINHKDCNKQNNSIHNLEYCSRLDNTRHAVENGRISLSGATLSELHVHEIRRLYRPRRNSKELAAQFGVTQRTIVRIASGELWSHVSRKPT